MTPMGDVMDADLVIANAMVVGPEGVEVANVAVRGETIAAVGRGPASGARTVVGSTDEYLIPGGVDVHLELPFCGTTSSDDWETGTKAAARGGATTVIDFAIPYDQESLRDAFEN
jgi:dihydropyrimidinase